MEWLQTPPGWAMAVVILLAVAIDVALGEPPNRLHPVAWMGTAIGWGRQLGRRRNFRPAAACAFGTLLVVIGVATMWAIGVVLSRLPWPLHAVVLTTCLGVRALSDAAALVAASLGRGELPVAREQVAYHLVSRDTSEATEAEVAAAVIASVAENTCDSVVAPLFWFVVGGLPAVLVYRFANTADAMLGYRTPALKWLGKPAARLDDALNLIPARLSAAWMLLLHPSTRATRTWWSDAGRTPSPCGGHPMSAAAGILGVRLAKPGVYVLGDHFREPGGRDIAAMRRIYWHTVAASVLLSAGCVLLAGGCLWNDMEGWAS